MKRLAIIDACTAVIDMLKPRNGAKVWSSSVYGLRWTRCSVFSRPLNLFPVVRPREDENDKVIENYEGYAFTSDLLLKTWFKFLQTYFEKTERLIV